MNLPPRRCRPPRAPCRYLAFTYFALPLQQQVLACIRERLLSRGYLVIGTHETLPPGCGLVPLDHAPQIFRRGADELARLGRPQEPGEIDPRQGARPLFRS